MEQVWLDTVGGSIKMRAYGLFQQAYHHLQYGSQGIGTSSSESMDRAMIMVMEQKIVELSSQL
ncbi:hypothetical protein HAX54_004540, partial [Datura stramonium]|nr:hypothetical protein [Datura stramonium]